MEMESAESSTEVTTSPEALETSTGKQESEEDFGTCFISTYVCQSPEEAVVMEKLRNLSCHFTWDLSTSHQHTKKSVSCLVQGLKDKVDEESKYGNDSTDHLNCYFHAVQLGFYATVLKQYSAADEYLNLAASMANHVPLSEIKTGLLYIVDGNRAFVALLSGNYELCETLLSTVAVYWANLQPPSKAAITGNYAVTLMEVGIGGSYKALSFLRDAIKMDEKFHEWHLRLGMALMRIRHTQGRYISPAGEECSEFELGFKLAPSTNSRVAVYLAQNLREKSFNNEPERQENENNAKLLFDMALKRNPDSSDINIRCADGYMNLRFQNRDLVLAEECIKKAVSIAENNAMVCHKAATFYERFKKDYETALNYLEKLSEKNIHIIAADFRRLDLKLFLDNTINSIDELTRLKEFYKSQRSAVIGILSCRGLIQYMKFGNLTSALEDWMEAMLMDKRLFKNEFLRHLRSMLIFKDISMKDETKIKMEELKQRLGISRNSETDQQKLLFFGELQLIVNMYLSGPPNQQNSNQNNQHNHHQQQQQWRPNFQQRGNNRGVGFRTPFNTNRNFNQRPQWNQNGNNFERGRGNQGFRGRYYAPVNNNSFNMPR